MGILGARQVECSGGEPTRVIGSLWTNVPMEFLVEVEPRDAVGTWVVRRSWLPAGIAMAELASGPITPQMRFRRKYLDSSFEVEVVTDRPATLSVRRSG